MSRKVAIYGGSFNPIHTGHTRLAQSLVQEGHIDEVWLMVSPLNPLKQQATNDIAPYAHRLNMAQLATEGLTGVRASDFESRLPLPSYTVHTLAALCKAWPQHEFALVIGADNWTRFSRWYHNEEIRHHYPIIIYPRPGYDIRDTADGDIHVAQGTTLYDISSTRLRQAIRQGQDTGEWLDPRVRSYIDENRLYI